MRGGVDGALQLPDQIRNGAVQVVRDMANRPPVMRLPRMNPNGLKQCGGLDVVGMGDKWDRHPALDGLIYCADLPRLTASPGGEDERSSECQHEGQPDSQRAPPCVSHASIIARFLETESRAAPLKSPRDMGARRQKCNGGGGFPRQDRGIVEVALCRNGRQRIERVRSRLVEPGASSRIQCESGSTEVYAVFGKSPGGKPNQYRTG